MSVFYSMQCKIKAGISFDTAIRQAQNLSYSHGCPCEIIFNGVHLVVDKDTLLEDLHNEYYDKLGKAKS